MSFSSLYNAVQQDHTENGRVSTRWLTKEAIKLSSITKIKEQWSEVIDPMFLRGLYIEGPIGAPVPLLEKESLIVLSRSMVTGQEGKYWRRFIYTKELMHVFDTEEEIANTEEKFDLQSERLADPSAESSPQYIAELKARWRALAVLCPESHRTKFKRELSSGDTSIVAISAHLHLPVTIARNLFRDGFEEIVKDL